MIHHTTKELSQTILNIRAALFVNDFKEARRHLGTMKGIQARLRFAMECEEERLEKLKSKYSWEIQESNLRRRLREYHPDGSHTYENQ
jgi:hypothetical protein